MCFRRPQQDKGQRCGVIVMDATENSMKGKKRKGKKNRKKGFTDEQIRLLETIFESETKPEPKQKVELAAELGLQPRQVAIWFQNRRARWKSKRIEKDYNVLRDRYNNLATAYEDLKKEHHDLHIEIQRLTGILGRSNGSSGICSEPCKEEQNLVGEDSSHDDSMKEIVPYPRSFELLNIEEEDDDDGSQGTLEERWCNLAPNCSTDADDFSLSSAPWWNSWT